MHHLGLLMHAGTLDENGNHQMKSKTEAMFIPAHPMTQEDIDAATTDIVFGTQYVPSSEYLPERCHQHQYSTPPSKRTSSSSLYFLSFNC
jgi:hypothetical protein